MDRTFILHMKSSTKIVTESDEIKNALDQENEGVDTHYRFYDYKNCEAVTPPGWLIWSTLQDGFGVAYRLNDGKMIVTTRTQSDFAYC